MTSVLGQNQTSAIVNATSDGYYPVMTSSNGLYTLQVKGTLGGVTLRIQQSGATTVFEYLQNIADADNTISKIKFNSSYEIKFIKSSGSEISTASSMYDPATFSSNANAKFLMLTDNGTLDVTDANRSVLFTSATLRAPSPSLGPSAPEARLPPAQAVQVTSDLQRLEDIFFNKNIITYSVMLIIFVVTFIMFIVFMFTSFKTQIMGAIGILIINAILITYCVMLIVIQTTKKLSNMASSLQFHNPNCGRYQQYVGSVCTSNRPGYRVN